MKGTKHMNYKIGAGPTFSGVKFYETHREDPLMVFDHRHEEIYKKVKGKMETPCVFSQSRVEDGEKFQDIFVADKTEGKLLKTLEQAYENAIDYTLNSNNKSTKRELRNIHKNALNTFENAKKFFAEQCLAEKALREAKKVL